MHRHVYVTNAEPNHNSHWVRVPATKQLSSVIDQNLGDNNYRWSFRTASGKMKSQILSPLNWKRCRHVRYKIEKHWSITVTYTHLRKYRWHTFWLGLVDNYLMDRQIFYYLRQLNTLYLARPLCYGIKTTFGVKATFTFYRNWSYLSYMNVNNG